MSSSGRRPYGDDERASKSQRTNDGRDAASSANGSYRGGGGGGYGQQQQQQPQQHGGGGGDWRSREQGYRGGSGGAAYNAPGRWNNAPSGGSAATPAPRPAFAGSGFVHRDRAIPSSSGTAAAPASRPGQPQLSRAAQAIADAAAAERARAEEEAYRKRVEEQLTDIVEAEEKTEEELAEERRKRREAILAKHKLKPEPAPTEAVAAAPVAAPETLAAAAKPAAAAAAPAAPAAAPASVTPAMADPVTSELAPASVPASAPHIAPAYAAHDAADGATAPVEAAAAAAAHARAAASPPVAAVAAAPAAADDDEFDMFSDSPSGLPGADGSAAAAGGAGGKGPAGEMLDSYDDHEGYYRFRAGDLLEGGRYRVVGLQGSGVFSTVLKVKELIPGLNGAPSSEGRDLVVKLIRSNDTMLRAGQKELEFLRLLSAQDPDNRKHVVKLLHHFMHRGHLCLVFEPMSMDLRKVIKKFGSVGVSLAAVRSYAKQLCIALRHLKKCAILHGDLKPDNMLVNDAMNVVKICDLGSAGRLDEQCELTPYLCSRYYRAPEVMLGLKYDERVDLWSVGTVLYELYTGRVLFAGNDNNSMLKCIQDIKGRFPKRILMRAAFAAQHFDAEGVFEFRKRDTTAPQGVRVTKIRYQDKPNKDLYAMLRDATGAKATHAEHAKLKQLADFIHQCTALDPAQRPSADTLLSHPFIVDE